MTWTNGHSVIVIFLTEKCRWSELLKLYRVDNKHVVSFPIINVPQLHHPPRLDTSSESLEPINGYQNGYQSEPFSDDDVELPGNCGYQNGYHNDTTNNGYHGNPLRDTVAQTEEHCRKMYEEFKKLRKQLRDVSGE